MEFGARLPKRVRFWVTMKEIGHATTKSTNVPATSLDYILNHLDTPKNMS